MNELVIFHDTEMRENDKSIGVKLDDGNIVCLCCGGFIEPEDCTIEKVIPWLTDEEINALMG